jgi:hypothetical protein
MLGPAALLQKVRRDLGLALSTKEVALLIAHFDPERCKLLDYRELLELVRSFTRQGATDNGAPVLTEREEKMQALVEEYREGAGAEAARKKASPKGAGGGGAKQRKAAPLERQGGIARAVRTKGKMGDKHR